MSSGAVHLGEPKYGAASDPRGEVRYREAMHSSLSTAPVVRYARSHRQRFVTELCEFLRLPSVSSTPRSAAIRRCASWLAVHGRRIGLERVGIIPTPGAPLVHGCWRHAAAKPTVLVYGHYDVQPPEPLDAWVSPPFAPAVRRQNLYARGASDDKGQLFTHLKACESWLRTTGRLPVNVKCLFEGEEEVGSTHFRSVLERYRSELGADVAVISDTQMLGPSQPALTCSLRGMLSLELEVTGPDRDLHSGSYGGAIHNPIQALNEILCQLHDSDGRVKIPHFYNSVRDSSLLTCRSGASPTRESFLRRAGVLKGWGESDFTLHERTTIRPALTINGIRGGYQGPGGKGIIPSSASTKLSFRLVPDQDPAEIEYWFRKHIAGIAPPTVRVRMRTLAMSRPVVTPERHPFLRAAARAYRRAFGVEPVLQRSGGTIPVVNAFREVLGIPSVLMGFALPDDDAHGPNEKLHLPTFFRGIETSIHFLQAMEGSP
jgi:acetylornithine deacetylase/succinyl-diaminopimelate desuccinylase-like protein